MEAPDLTHQDRTSPAKMSGIENLGKGGVDSLSNEWTDAKHNLYLSSIEATFVNQLYGSEHLSSDLLWLTRVQKKVNPSGSSTNERASGQFKVMRQGCWGNLKFERTKSREAIENESSHLLASPWVQHFKPHIGRQPQETLNMDSNDFMSQSIYLKTHMEVKKPSSKQLPDCYPLKYPQYPVSSRAEVSDQNFVDTENKLRKDVTKPSSKKRSRRTANSKIIDQLVPCSALATYSPRSANFLKDKDAEICNIIKQRDSDGPSYYNHEKIDGLGLIMGDLQRGFGSGGETITGD